MPQENTITMRDVRLVFRNFAGKEGPFNAEGDRNFSVILPEDVARQMEVDGWNVKRLRPREDDEEGIATPYIQVTVKYRGRGGKEVRPPRIVMLSSAGRTELGEEEVEVLDWADIRQADLIIRPYEWSVNGKGGIKAYAKSLFVTIEEDELEQEYATVQSIPASAGRVADATYGEGDG